MKKESFFNCDVFCNDKKHNSFLNKKREKDNDCDYTNEEITNITTITETDNSIKNIDEKNDNILYIGCEDGTIKVIELSNEIFVRKFFS